MELPVRADIAELYAKTCESFGGRQPRDGELDAWLDVLSPYPASDIDAAIRRWRSIVNIEEWTHRPQGSRFPSPVELKIEIERFNAATSESFHPCNQGDCENGWVRVFTGLTVGGNPVDAKIGAVKRHSCFQDWVERRKAMQK